MEPREAELTELSMVTVVPWCVSHDTSLLDGQPRRRVRLCALRVARGVAAVRFAVDTGNHELVMWSWPVCAWRVGKWVPVWAKRGVRFEQVTPHRGWHAKLQLSAQITQLRLCCMYATQKTKRARETGPQTQGSPAALPAACVYSARRGVPVATLARVASTVRGRKGAVSRHSDVWAALVGVSVISLLTRRRQFGTGRWPDTQPFQEACVPVVEA